MTTDRFELFTTPVVVFRPDGTDELNRGLTERLVAEAKDTPGIRRSNVGGWHSIPDLTQRRDPYFQGLFQLIVHHVGQVIDELAQATHQPRSQPYRYAVEAWAMVMNAGDYTIVHDHAATHWSTVYYLDAGDADADAHPDSGTLSFIDPRGAMAGLPGLDLFPGQFSVKPRTGILVVFPGWLRHYVHPYRGTRPRVCVSSNLRCEIAPPRPAG
jgi:uncharacterized protein (TIGR02466 family)